MQVQSDSGTLAPYVPRALLARLARQPIDVLTETVEGTMVFADVSGFTRLSERLARAGEEGAEQLVDVINGCFTALLADAYGRGGSLVKFGGDAMLLFFYDDEHTERACSAAAAMRRTLREVGHIRAGPTNVVLRMSVGVHRGDYPMFVVGASHRELLDRRRGGNDRGGDGERRVFGSDRDQLTNRASLAACLRRRERRPGIPACAFPVGRRLGLPARACGSH